MWWWNPFEKIVQHSVLIELTVPWEDCMEEANERKQSKYQKLMEQCQIRGWKAVHCVKSTLCSSSLGLQGEQSSAPWRLW